MNRKIQAGFAALILVFTGGAFAQEESVVAEVVSVDIDARTLTVELDENGRQRTFDVDDETEISFEGRLSRLQDGALQDIEAGDEVELTIEMRGTQERVRNFRRDRLNPRNLVTQTDSADTANTQTSSQNSATQQVARRLPSTAQPLWMQFFVAGLMLFSVFTVARVVRITR